MMIVSGVLTISLSLWFAVRFQYVIFLQGNMLFAAWLFLLPQLILIFAGVLSLLYRPVHGTEGRAVPPSDNAG
jgi:hypothetical protein